VGGTALASGPIGASRTSVATFRVTTTRPSELSFWYRVSSERGWDFFRVVVEGGFPPMPAAVSGEVGWTQALVPLMIPGTYSVSFVYDKDGSIGVGDDRALIDDVMLNVVGEGPSVAVGPGPIVESFEGPDLPPGARTTAGLAAWFVDPTQAFDGDASVASGVIGDEMSTFLELDITSGTDEGVEVMVRTSTENNYDFFELLVDGVLSSRLAGEHEWTALAAALGPPGEHVVTLRYRKDVNTVRGADRVWVDALRIGPVLAGGGPQPSVCR
jgi:hypothetical protein